MQELKRGQALAGAAAHLCAAYEELTAAGFDGWGAELKGLIDIIDAEIDWLRGHDRTILVADP
jgi:hypothetical protein